MKNPLIVILSGAIVLCAAPSFAQCFGGAYARATSFRSFGRVAYQAPTFYCAQPVNACEAVGVCEAVGACEATKAIEVKNAPPACGACETCAECACGSCACGSVKTSTTVQRTTTARPLLSFLDVVNQARLRAGVGPLILDVSLQTGARQHSELMRSVGALFHARPGCAENCAKARTIGEAVSMWTSSPAHAANLFNARYTRAGIGVARDASGRAYFTLRLL